MGVLKREKIGGSRALLWQTIEGLAETITFQFG